MELNSAIYGTVRFHLIQQELVPKERSSDGVAFTAAKSNLIPASTSRTVGTHCNQSGHDISSWWATPTGGPKPVQMVPTDTKLTAAVYCPVEAVVEEEQQSAHASAEGASMRKNRTTKRRLAAANADKRYRTQLRRGRMGTMSGGGDQENETFWHRMKWTDEMVKLLITAAAYAGEYARLISQQNRSQKKGKWKAISEVMMQRGFLVSPQQCEDKFNDLNKKYKRLNEILGKGTACDVVENPSVMDTMNLSDETAEEIIRILSSKQLFYQEMCSYHNENFLHLPRDEDLEHSIRLAIKGKGRNINESDDQDLMILDEKSAKRMRPTAAEEEGEGHVIIVPENDLNDCKEQKSVSIRLQELEAQRLELEKERLKWLEYSQNEDRKVEKMNLENKMMKLQNQRFTFELESLMKGKK
ncbi:hypothetical protein M9H77_20787 [Catharanthus roseus]|uniref:Uncharacterized protein n=1 Tax=Catharanthus roseus TaxID=4058 RepID=A0ACC0AKX2_CATRO|nr:hypothetical protein M9H77_20787 [Catharanthus roseus]